MAHSRENKHQSRYSFKKRSSQYGRKQQEHLTPKGRAIVKKNNSQNHHDKKEDNSKGI